MSLVRTGPVVLPSGAVNPSCRVTFCLFFSLISISWWGSAEPSEFADNPASRCAQAVVGYSESVLDDALNEEIQARPADFFELVSYEVGRLLSEQSDVATLASHWDRIKNFLPEERVPYCEEGYSRGLITERTRRLLAPAVQSELDHTHFGKYSSQSYRAQLSGEAPISQLVFIAWPRLNRLTNDQSTFAVNISSNPELATAPRVVVSADHLNRAVLDLTSRAVFEDVDLSWPFPGFLFRTEAGQSLTVHFMGGTIDRRGGALLRALLEPSLKARSVSQIAVRLRAGTTYALPPAGLPPWEWKSQFYGLSSILSGKHDTPENLLRNFAASLWLTSVEYVEQPIPTLRGVTREGVPFEATLELPSTR